MGNQVWNALAGPYGLSRTMSERGGVTDARLRAADSLMNMKRMGAADKRARELHEARMPGLRLQQSKDEAAMELGPIPRDEHMPTDSVTGTVQYFSKDKNGVSNFGVSERAIPGSTWVKGEDGREYRADKDGQVLQLPKWRRDKIRQNSMLFTIVRNDPKHFLNDQVLELQMKQESDPEQNAVYQQKIDQIKAVLKDPKQMIDLYGKQLTAGTMGLAGLVAENADRQYIDLVKSEIDRTRKKIDALTTTAEEAKKLKVLDKQLALIDLQMKKLTTTKEEAKKLKVLDKQLALINLQMRKLGIGKPMTQYQGAQLRANALKIMNKEVENMSLSGDWTRLGPEGQAAWKTKRFEEIMQALQPSAGTGREGLGRGAPVTILTGPAATKKANELIGGINRGVIDAKQILDRLLQSGQREVGHQVIEALEAMQTGDAGAASAPEVAPYPGISSLTKEAEKFRNATPSQKRDWAAEAKRAGITILEFLKSRPGEIR